MLVFGKLIAGRKSGSTLLETVVALAIMGTIAVVFLGGIIGSTRAASISDEKTTAESLAQSQMEWAQNATYIPDTTQYTPAALPDGQDYITYSANIAVSSLNNPENGIQKITVTILRSGKSVFKLEGYKVNR